MTDKQKHAVLIINDVKQNGYIDEEAYMELLELIMQTPQYVHYPIETPIPTFYGVNPWWQYQTICKSECKVNT